MKRFWVVFVLVTLLVAGSTAAVWAQDPGESPIATPTAVVDPGGDPGGELPALELSGPGIAAVVALVLSLVLAYIPGFSDKWEAFEHKREAMAGFGFVVAWAFVGLHYAGAVDLGLGPFGWPVINQVVTAWLAFAGAGQLMYTVERL